MNTFYTSELVGKDPCLLYMEANLKLLRILVLHLSASWTDYNFQLPKVVFVTTVLICIKLEEGEKALKISRIRIVCIASK